MCGIIGFCTEAERMPPFEFLNECRDKLRHRGPDAAGAWLDHDIYLGFRRLAILDLSAAGDQPMHSEDGRYTIVFNGEIYNFLELRAELVLRGERFRGHSDTEVLLCLLAKYGTRALEKINGMFAFAIFDRQTRTVVLARDRLGVKPLYYWHSGRKFGFGSEVCGIQGLPTFPTNISIDALALYFRLGTVPDWSSVYVGLKKLPPGCWLGYNLETGVLGAPTSFWDLPPVQESPHDSEQLWLDRIESLLWDATRIRLRADVPLGVFLSGGIDSGLVAAAAAAQRVDLSSMTVGFAGHPEDESVLALATALHLGIRHAAPGLSLNEGLGMMPATMAHFDEPFSDASALPTSLVCAEAGKHFKVVLSGDGGDELFGGYESHVRAWRWRAVDRVPVTWRRAAGRIIRAVSPQDSLPERFAWRLGQEVGRFGLGGKRFLFQAWLDGCLQPEFNLHPRRLVELTSTHQAAWAEASSLDLAQRVDIRGYLLDDILVKVDRMSMRHSIEVRSPFLDYRLVELALQVPSRLRTCRGENKYLLRRLARRHLPRTVSRAAKRGFGVPLGMWLFESRHREDLRAVLRTADAGFPEPFLPGGADRLWDRAEKNPALHSALFAMLSYRWWCLGQRDRNRTPHAQNAGSEQGVCAGRARSGSVG